MSEFRSNMMHSSVLPMDQKDGKDGNVKNSYFMSNGFLS